MCLLSKIHPPVLLWLKWEMEKCIWTLCDWTGARNPDRDIFLVAIGQEDALARAEALNLTAPFSEWIWPNAGGQRKRRPMQKL